MSFEVGEPQSYLDVIGEYAELYLGIYWGLDS